MKYISKYTGAQIDSVVEKVLTSGGSANIDVTAQVGQTIIVKEVDAEGKPTAWEAVDLQERTHWTEEAVLCEGTSDVDSEIGCAIFECTAKISVGETYKVIWGGTEYICEAVDGSVVGESGAAVLGNVAGTFGSGDTGEPFLLITSDGVVMALPLDGSTTVTLAIVGYLNHTIPKKYMPKETLFGDRKCQKPVLDISTWADKYGEYNILGITETATEYIEPTDEQYVNTELTKTQYEEILEYFKDHTLVYNIDAHATTMGEVAELNGQQVCRATFYGIDYNLVCYKVHFRLRWSDTENCVQKVCIEQY